MLSRRTDLLIELVVMLCFVGGLLVLGWWLSSYRCHARWEGSGMESEFRLFAGCLVKTNAGWIPDDRIREVQP